ncbi:MAG: flagellar motor protein MotD [Ignavibacteria bacterium]|nr:flagellar motor protein MotD [Ignavibacteria bacterium]
MLNKDEKYSQGAAQTDRFLLTYSDLITLLLGLFVVLYASAHVDESKYKKLSAAFSQYFNFSSKTNGNVEKPENKLPDPILPQTSSMPMALVDSQLKSSLQTFIRDGTVRINTGKDSLTILISDPLLFKSGHSDLLISKADVLDSLCQLFSGNSYQVIIDGHTDSDKIKTGKFQSNWHLSASRAISVAKKLISGGINENDITIRAFGSNRPIRENTTGQGKSDNRRVELTITKKASDSPSNKGYSNEQKADRL